MWFFLSQINAGRESAYWGWLVKSAAQNVSWHHTLFGCISFYHIFRYISLVVMNHNSHLKVLWPSKFIVLVKYKKAYLLLFQKFAELKVKNVIRFLKFLFWHGCCIFWFKQSPADSHFVKVASCASLSDMFTRLDLLCFLPKMIMHIYLYVNWIVIVLNVLWSCVELIDYVWVQILIFRIQRLSLPLSHACAHTRTLCDVTVLLISFIWWWTIKQIKHFFW